MDNLTPAQQKWSDFISEFYGDICDTEEQNYFWGLALAGEPPPTGWTDAEVEKYERAAEWIEAAHDR